jgi:hypothetical protein
MRGITLVPVNYGSAPLINHFSPKNSLNSATNGFLLTYNPPPPVSLPNVFFRMP